LPLKKALKNRRARRPKGPAAAAATGHSAHSGHSGRVTTLVRALGLRPHPEGGAFAEHYRGAEEASTAIYYLLRPGMGSRWHRVAKDELWHHYEGAVVEIHLITEADSDEKCYRVLRLGPVGRRGARPCQVVPAGAWQAARMLPEAGAGSSGDYALVGNTIAPGFRFSDWKLADVTDLARLAARAPEARRVLRALAPLD